MTSPRRISANRRRLGCGGFTLLEAVVSTLIVSVALLLASGLLRTAAEAHALAASRATDPLPDLAVRQIAADLRTAGGALGGEVLWSRDPLVLTGHPAGRVELYLEGRELRRRVGSGESATERVLLMGVSTWRWRLPHQGLAAIEVDLGYRRRERLRPGRKSNGEELAMVTERRRRLAISPRGGGRKGW